MRYDYLTRFGGSLWEKGGFKRFGNEASIVRIIILIYAANGTGAGHAFCLYGDNSICTCIIANDWY